MLIDTPAFAAIDPSIDDATLVARLSALVGREREARAEFIVHLAAFDQRRLYLAAGFPSLFAWLTDCLRLARASAFRRVTAARLYARMPAVAAYLREGRLSLTKLCMLKDVLEPDNCLTLLEQAASMSESDVESLVNVVDPSRQQPPRESIRTLPPPAMPAQEDLFTPRPATAEPPAPAVAENTRHLIKITVGSAFMTLLDEVRTEIGRPGESLEVLLTECMRRAVDASRKRRRAISERPRKTRGGKKGSRTIPAQVRREVWKRDEARCTFVARDGRRCAAVRDLELHHEVAYVRGGPATVENIRILCRAHNDFMARAEFGDAFMDQFTSAAAAGGV